MGNCYGVCGCARVAKVLASEILPSETVRGGYPLEQMLH